LFYFLFPENKQKQLVIICDKWPEKGDVLSQFIKFPSQYALKEDPSNPGETEIEYVTSDFSLQ
jgi:hypothetical protein